MKVRKLRFWKHADAGWFRDLDLACFPRDEPFLNGLGYHWWVCEHGVEVVGYAGLHEDGRDVHLCRAGVMPEWRQMGIHRLLVEARVRWARRRGFKTVRTYAALDNPRCWRNLRAGGFRSRRGSEYLLLWRDL
jgi:GNAT superfamily N-acetyltransferase